MPKSTSIQITEFDFTTKSFILNVSDYITMCYHRDMTTIFDTEKNEFINTNTSPLDGLHKPEARIVHYFENSHPVSNFYRLDIRHEVLVNEPVGKNNKVVSNWFRAVEYIQFRRGNLHNENNNLTIEIVPSDIFEIPERTHSHKGSFGIFRTIAEYIENISSIVCKDVETGCQINFPEFKPFMAWITNNELKLMDPVKDEDVTALFSEILKSI